MPINNKQPNSKLENSDTRMDVSYPSECHKNSNENERLELGSIRVPTGSYEERLVGSGNNEVNDSKNLETSSPSILRHRRKSIPPIEGTIDNIDPNCEMNVSQNDGKGPPNKYLQIYTTNCTDSHDPANVLEQSKRPLLSEKERLVAIVKPTNSETNSNIVVSQKDESDRPLNMKSKTFPPNDSDRLQCEQNTDPDNPLDGRKNKDEIVSVDFDAILPYVGEMGRYQLALYLLMCIPAPLPAAFLAFNQVFLSATPTHWCKEPHLQKFNDVCLMI